MTALLQYVEMTLTDLQRLDKAQTVFLMAVSPIEVHGPHLPTGTDVIISSELVRRYADALRQAHPELTLVALPPLYAGSDALPVPGSLSVQAKGVQGVLEGYADGLAGQGFRYLFVADNHGGPRHHLAIESAARRAWKRHRFYVIDPFEVEYRRMCHLDPGFLAETGLGPGTCGDDSDAHAGTNETSLILAIDPRLAQGHREVPVSVPPPAKLRFLAGLAGVFGGTRVRADLRHLGNTLGWVTQKGMKPYMGDPSKATAEAGEAMLKARVKIAMELFEEALRGQKVDTRPMLWGLRVLKHLPE